MTKRRKPPRPHARPRPGSAEEREQRRLYSWRDLCPKSSPCTAAACSFEGHCLAIARHRAALDNAKPDGVIYVRWASLPRYRIRPEPSEPKRPLSNLEPGRAPPRVPDSVAPSLDPDSAAAAFREFWYSHLQVRRPLALLLLLLALVEGINVLAWIVRL